MKLYVTLFVCLLPFFWSEGSGAEDHSSRSYTSPFKTGVLLPDVAVRSGEVEVNIRALSNENPIILVRFLGYQCSHCVQQLTYLNEYAPKLKELGISVYAFSSDDADQCVALAKNLHYNTSVIHILSDPNDAAAKSIQAVTDAGAEGTDLHASIVLYKGSVLFSAYSEQPFMDIGQLVSAASFNEHAVKVQQANTIDRYLSATISIKNIAGPSDGLVAPLDLDFNTSPLHPNDLWVVTTDGGGHSMAIVHDAGKPNQSVRLKKDSRASHFMWRTMGIAMAKNGTFATAQNGQNGDHDPFYQFMGPTLWSSDTAVFASRYQTDNQVLASHLDMLHQSPMCNGIAHDSASIFWVSDGFYGDVCRYDYRDPHEVGGTDHRDGIIRRFSDVKITKGERGRPAHLALHHASGWLYYVDPGANTVQRLNTRTGASTRDLFPPDESMENYTEYTEWLGASVDTVIKSGLGEPVGIEVAGNRLLVGDRLSGKIHVFDIDAQPITKVGTIETNATELLGICVDQQNKIWFVDRGTGTVNLIQTNVDHEVRADVDVRVAGKDDVVTFQYTNAASEQRSVQFNSRFRTLTPQGASEWSPHNPLLLAQVAGNATVRVAITINELDTLSATEFEIVEDNGTVDGGTRANTICVPRSLRRAVVDDAYMETFNITDAVVQTERPGYASLRSDVFVRVADSLTQLQVVLWNGGSFGEISVTDDAILSSLITREVEILLVADDPLLLRTDLPNSPQFFGRFGVSIFGADDVAGDGGQRVFTTVIGDTITGGLGNVDCQYPRLNHTRGGDYVPGTLFRAANPKAIGVLKKTSTQFGCVRYNPETYRTVILGVNAARFVDGIQRTSILKNALIWLEAATKIDSIPDDTTTWVAELSDEHPLRVRSLGNPVTDEVRLLIEGNALGADIGVYSVGGQRLRSTSNVEISGMREVSIDLSGLATGTYFVIVTTERSLTHCTIIKQ